jgi:hypothetical protein
VWSRWAAPASAHEARAGDTSTPVLEDEALRRPREPEAAARTPRSVYAICSTLTLGPVGSARPSWLREVMSSLENTLRRW